MHSYLRLVNLLLTDAEGLEDIIPFYQDLIMFKFDLKKEKEQVVYYESIRDLYRKLHNDGRYDFLFPPLYASPDCG